MQIQTGEVTFSMRRKGEDLADGEVLEGGDFPRSRIITVGGFEAPIKNPAVFLTGFDVEFEPASGEGRPFGNLDVRLEVADPLADAVEIKAIFGLRDWSGDWDDEHQATIQFTVVAE